jgi:hypothetical protein
MARQLAVRDHLGFVAELANGLREAYSRPGLSAEERGRYARWIEHAGALDGVLRSKTGAPAKRHDPDDLSDLPPELLQELQLRRTDQLELQIVAVLRTLGGCADLDRILIGLYRQFQSVQKRRVLQNKMWRLVRKGRVTTSKDRRGHFTLVSAKPPRPAKRKRKK